MKKFLFVSAVILAILSLMACAPSMGPIPPGTGDAWAHNNDGTFEIKLYTDKQDYKEGEPVTCYATVEYVGEGDSVTIYSSDPLVGFGLKDDKYFDGKYVVDDVLITTQFNKGEPVTYEFVKSGSWSSDDKNAEFYERFYNEKQLILPPGDYVITAAINGFFDKDDYEGSKYSLSANVNIRVE